MMTRPTHIALTLTGVAALTLAAACNSPRASSASSAIGVQQSAQQISTAYSELDETSRSLNNLVYTPAADLRPQFKAFSDNLNELSEIAEEIRSTALQMQVRGQNYFQNWQDELATMRSPAVREASTDRRDEVLDQFNETTELYREANRALTEYVSELRDIRAHLQTDLTPAGLDAIRDQVEDINEDTADVRDSLASVVDHFQRMSASLPMPNMAVSGDE